MGLKNKTHLNVARTERDVKLETETQESIFEDENDKLYEINSFQNVSFHSNKNHKNDPGNIAHLNLSNMLNFKDRSADTPMVYENLSINKFSNSPQFDSKMSTLKYGEKFVNSKRAAKQPDSLPEANNDQHNQILMQDNDYPMG